ncbi:ABC transporter substrate-binding protein [Undibacterium sp. Ji83W]|uniref:ABC transporter substrate-binding protein n=1 Tax=Undibacterium sp. Ji83W TaxID=3413043 RepID=UPI003BF3E207
MYSSIKNKVVTISLSFISCIALLNINEAQARAGEREGTATAFAISKNGHLATNFHVINGMSEIIVFDRDKKAYPAKVIASDRENDLAILSIDKTTIPLFLENTQRIRKGSEVSAMGFPNVDLQGYEAKFTNGTITAESGSNGDVRFFQISAPIQPGNSGGPLLDSRGSVIGIVTSKLNDKLTLMDGVVAQNVNYAVKVPYLLAMISSTRAVRDELLKAPAKSVRSREDVAELAESAVYLVYGRGKDTRAAPESSAKAPNTTTPAPTSLQESGNNPQLATIPGTQLIRLGHVGPLTGAISHLGRDNENGARMAIEDLNALNLVIGGQLTKFELIAENDGADPRQGNSSAQRLVNMGVKGVVGHLNSGTTIPASEIYFRAGIPQISPSATNPKFTKQGFSTAFRMVANDEALAGMIAKVATRDLAARKIAVVDDGTIYGTGIAYAFRLAAEQNGASIATVQSVASNTTDFNAEITAIKNSSPDLIFFGGMDMQAGPLLQQLSAQGVNVKFVGSDGICTSALPRMAKDTIQNDQVFCGEAGGVEAGRTAILDEFKRKYKNRFGMDVLIYAPYVYDSFFTLVSAMKRANSVEPQQYLNYMKAVRLNGVTGVISFDDRGDIQQPALTLYTYRNGRRVLHHVTR